MSLRRLSRTRAPLRALRGNERGAAAVEFALWSALFFLVVGVALDFGAYYLARGKMNEALSGAAISAFSTAEQVDFAELPAYVRALTGDESLSVSTACNGTVGSCTNESRTCACLKADGSYVAAECDSVCTKPGVTKDSTAGYYLTIEARQSFRPFIVPGGVLGDAAIVQQATVRLQ